MIKVSIIVPVYNTEKYLDKCIQSLISQTLEDIEIIFVDDGSTDNSPTILENYAQKDKRIRVFKQNHSRQGIARNHGINLANGEYIAFVDSDDWVATNMFESLYNRAVETNSDIVMCSIKAFDNQKEKFIVNTYNTLDIFDKSFLSKTFSAKDTLDFIFNISVSPCNKIYRREIITNNNIKFPPNIYFEDNVFFFNTWLKSRTISLLNQELYYYRKTPTSTLGCKNDKNKLDIFKMLDSVERILIKNKIYNQIKHKFKLYKQGTLNYWFNAIKDKKIKFIFYLMMLCSMPQLVFSPVLILYKELKLLFMLNFEKKKKIVFWGASLFLRTFLTKYKIKNNNVIGIIDRNQDIVGTIINEFKVYSPEEIPNLNPDRIIISIINFGVESKKTIEQYLEKNDIKECELELL